MTFLDAIRAADTGAPALLPIRRTAWVTGLRIWYSRETMTWWSRHADDPPHPLHADHQQVLVPESILAEDWEVISK